MNNYTSIINLVIQAKGEHISLEFTIVQSVNSEEKVQGKLTLIRAELTL